MWRTHVQKTLKVVRIHTIAQIIHKVIYYFQHNLVQCKQWTPYIKLSTEVLKKFQWIIFQKWKILQENFSPNNFWPKLKSFKRDFCGLGISCRDYYCCSIYWQSGIAWTFFAFVSHSKSLVLFFEPQPSEGDQITIRKIRNYVVDYPHEVIVLTFFSKAFWSKWDYEHRLHFQPRTYPGPLGSSVILFWTRRNCKSVPLRWCSSL